MRNLRRLLSAITKKNIFFQSNLHWPRSKHYERVRNYYERVQNITNAFKTLRTRSKHYERVRNTYERVQNITNAFKTLWTRSKHYERVRNTYERVQNITNAFKTLWTRSKHYERVRNTYERVQNITNAFKTLRTRSKHYERVQNIMNAFETLWTRSQLFCKASNENSFVVHSILNVHVHSWKKDRLLCIADIMADYPANLTRDELIRHYYFTLGYSYLEILRFLSAVHRIQLSIRQLHRILRSMQLKRRCLSVDWELAICAVQNQLSGKYNVYNLH